MIIDFILSPYLFFLFFLLVIDELTSNSKNDILWFILFIDDIKLVDETKIGINHKLELWRSALESKSLS